MKPDSNDPELRLICVLHDKELVQVGRLIECPECGPILDHPIALMWDDLIVMDSSTWHPRSRERR